MKKALNMACGKEIHLSTKDVKWINLDRTDFGGVDVIRDIMRGLPWNNDTFDVVLAKHILEHFIGEDLIFIIEEMIRVTKPGGHLEVVVPDKSSPNARRDPTHLTRDWDSDSFLFWAVDNKGEYVIHKGPAYNMCGKLELLMSEMNSNKDRRYQLRVLE